MTKQFQDVDLFTDSITKKFTRIAGLFSNMSLIYFKLYYISMVQILLFFTNWVVGMTILYFLVAVAKQH